MWGQNRGHRPLSGGKHLSASSCLRGGDSLTVTGRFSCHLEPNFERRISTSGIFITPLRSTWLLVRWSILYGGLVGQTSVSLIRQPDTGLKAGERNNPERPQFFCCCGVLQGSLLGLFLFLSFCHMFILTLGLDRARLSVSWRSWSSWLAQTPEW